MHFNKLAYMVPLAAAMLLSACGTSKKSAQNNQLEMSPVINELSMYKQLEFDRYFFDGLKEKMAGNYQRAAQNFESALRINNTSGAAHYELARAYLQMNRLPDVENEVNKAIKLEPKNKWYKLLLAEAYKFQNKWGPATDVYEKLVQENPESFNYYQELAGLYLYQNKPNEALKTYEKLEKQFGPTEDVILQRHRLYLETGKSEKAIEEIQKLIKTDPSARNYQILAETYLRGGQEAKALEVYNELLKKDPNDGATQLFLAEYYYKSGDKTKGFDMLKQAFGNSNLEIDHKIKLLYTQYLMPEGVSAERKQDAYELTELLVKAHPTDAKAHAIRGDFLYQDKKLTEARDAYRKSIEQKNDVFAVWQQIFFINSELHDSKAQEQETEKALEIFPSNAMVYFFSGIAKNDLKKYKEAIETLENGLNYNVDNPVLELQFYINLAEAHYRLKHYDEMDAYFEKALALDPNNTLALNNYAYYLSVRKQKLDKAAEMSKKTLQKEPENASYLDTYGWILFIQGKYTEAEKYIKKALDKDTKSPELYEHYGDVQFKLGNTDAAVQNWEKAKQLGSESINLTKKIADRKIYE